METRLDLEDNGARRVTPAQLPTYLAFRTAVPKPAGEDAHLRHILRFYVARTLAKEAGEAFVLPVVAIGDRRLTVDVAAHKDGGVIVAICEPAGVTAATMAALDVLKDAERTTTIIVHSRFAGPGEVPARYPQQLAERTFRLMSVVPPPFDDVFEYDIWMFELTFREAVA
jgi:hypothetical protein